MLSFRSDVTTRVRAAIAAPFAWVLVLALALSGGCARADTDDAGLSRPGADAMTRDANAADQASVTAHDFSFEAIDGGALPLSQFAGKTVLVVNTASMCGFTDQYDGLQALYERYGDEGLVVLGVPSNDFGGQEPGAAPQIKSFCETNFNVRFPLADKTVVSGATAHPFYQWARAQMGAERAPRWNFHKYLIDRQGVLVGAYASAIEPLSAEVTAAIETALADN